MTARISSLFVSLLLPLASLAAGCQSGLPGVPNDPCSESRCDDPAAPDAGSPLPSEARIAPETMSLSVGQEIQLTVWLVDQSNREMLVEAVPVFAASDDLVSLDGSGLLTALAPGETVVRAELDGFEVQATVIIAAEDAADDVVAIDPAVCCPGAVRGPEDKNFCFLPPNTEGCPMTFGDGYCDEDGDQNYSTPDAAYPECESDGTGCHLSGWQQGYADANAMCADYNGEESAPSLDATSACCALASDPNGDTDNICDVAPNTADCAPTQAGGYCDPNGDQSYEDGDWVRGYGDFQALCN